MKKLLSVFMAAVFALTMAPAVSFAGEAVDSGSCGETVSWTLDNAGTLTVSGRGDIQDYDGDSPFTNSEAIKTVVIDTGVTGIGAQTFSSCPSLTSVVISEGVTRIGDLAFGDCCELTSVEIPDSVESIGFAAFIECEKLTGIEIPANVTSIGTAAFGGCFGLTALPVDGNNPAYCDEDGVIFTKDMTAVVQYPSGKPDAVYALPESVTRIADGAFAYGVNLTGVEIPENVEDIGLAAFSYCVNLTHVTLPENITAIADQLFYECENLTNIEIPESVTSIGYAAFDTCISLASIKIPANVTCIETYAFFNCENLTDIELPDSVTNIGYAAFAFCGSLTSVSVPKSVIRIGEKAFYYCRSLRSLFIYNPECVIGAEAIYEDATVYGYTGSTAETYAKENGLIFSALNGESEVIAGGTCGERLTWMLDDAGTLTISGTGKMDDYSTDSADGSNYSTAPWCGSAENSARIKSVVIEEGVTDIGDFAFIYCFDLTSISLPDTVTNIGSYAFCNCGLTNVTIPDSVETISQAAFTNNIYMTSVSIGSGVTTIGNTAFNDCRKLISISIPKSVVSIGSWVFTNCSTLTSITVEDGNPVYHSAGDCLIETESKTLIYGCKTSVIPADGSVERIAYAAFVGMDIEQVVIPDSVTAIEGSAFLDCDALTDISIPKSVTSVMYGAFSDCDNLQAIRFYNPDCVIFENAVPANATVYGYTGSTAETYANENDLSFVSLGENPNPSVIESGACGDDLTWTLDEKGLLTIRGKGDMWDSNYNNDPFSQIKDDIKSIVIENGVTNIGAKTFSSCCSLTRVEIPSSVRSIGQFAFYDCDSLTNAEIPSGVTSIGVQAFYDCDSLTNVEIPESVASIGNYAFACCNSLTDLFVDINNQSYCDVNGVLFTKDHATVIQYPAGKTNDTYAIPSGVTNIGEGAFTECANLTGVEIPSGVISIGPSAFKECYSLVRVEIPDSVTSIGEYSFSSCSNLAHVEFPSSITSIETGMFYNSGLTSIEIPSSVTSIKADAFHRCWHLTDVEIPESVTSIGWTAFYECNSLKRVSIPASVTNIENSAFASCNSLTDITVDSENPFCCDIDGVLLSKDETELIQYPAGKTADFYEIPASVTRIGENAFSGCRNLTSVEIPTSVTSIGASAFSGCRSLTSVEIPSSVTILGWSAFDDCSALKSVYIYNPDCAIDGGSIYPCFTVYGYTGSTAETFANRSGRPFIDIENQTGPEIVDSGECGDDLTWTLDQEGTLIIRGTGDMWSFQWGSSPFYENNDIKTVVIENGATNIAAYTFTNCSNLTHVEIPEGVTSIGEYAFVNCRNLSGVEIPASVTSIDIHAFSNCSSLTELVIPENVSFIGASAFGYCNLTGISVDSNNLYYCDVDGVLFTKDRSTVVQYPTAKTNSTYVIPAGVTSIGNSAFANSGYLTSIEIPASVANIEYSAFQYCGNLTHVEIPDGVTEIKGSAFSYCYNLTSITIPKSVTEIGTEAFYFCRSLTDVEIPDCVTNIGEFAFYECSSLQTAYIYNPDCEIEDYALPENATVYGYTGSTAQTYANENGLTFVPLGSEPEALTEGTCGEHLTWTLDENGTLTIRGTGDMEDYSDTAAPWGGSEANRSRVKKVMIEDGVTSIGESAFALCTKLTNASVPDTVTKIGEYAFYHTGLTQFTVPGGVTSIESQTFGGCRELTEITIPDNVKRIASFAFSDCGFERVTIGDGVETIESAAFLECANLVSVSIGSGIKTIGAQAFYSGPYPLTDVYYNGTEGMWNNVEVGDFNFQTQVTIHFMHTEHTWDDGIVTTPATCAKKGVKTYTCTLCKATKTEKIIELAHTPEVIPAVPATCAKTGLTEGSKCAVCGKILTEQTATAKLPHTPEVIPGRDATCTQTGLSEGSKCAVCGAILKEQLVKERYAHLPKEIPAVPATCTKTGLTEGSVCVFCGTVLKEQTVTEKTDHTPEVIPPLDASCLETGLTEGIKCAVCGKILMEQTVTEKTPHTPQVIPAVPATCTKTGLTEGSRCSLCGKLLIAQTETEMRPHTWNDGEVTKEATVDAEGETTFTCTVCGAKKTEPIEKLPAPTVIDTDTVRETESGVTALAGVTAADLISLAGEGTKITKTDGSELKADELVGSGMTLTKPDGTEETMVIMGDVSGDGKVSAADARKALRQAVGLDQPKDWEKAAALVNGGEKVTAAAARKILRTAVGLETLTLN